MVIVDLSIILCAMKKAYLMRLRIVSSKREISELNSDEEIVHLTFRPSNTDVVALIHACSNLAAVHIPNSYKQTMSKSARMFLSVNNISLLEGNVWGHRKDIDTYFTISESLISEMISYHKSDIPREEIVKRVSRNSKLDPDLINYIIDQNSG